MVYESNYRSHELMHHGILGMHWGRKKSSMTPSTTHRQVSEDHITKTQLKKKHVTEMSNAELKQLNERLQLERQYKDLRKNDVSAGKKRITKLIQDVAMELAKDELKSAGASGLKKLKNTKKG